VAIVAARERWVVAATEILGTPVEEAVPLARSKEAPAAYFLGGAAIFGTITFLHEFGLIPGPTLVVYLVAATPMSLMFQMAFEPMFAVLAPTGIQMVSSTRWFPKPVAPALGPLDPATVTGPHGFARNAFEISGMTHRVPIWHRGRFQRMLADAARHTTG
jgi:hypothetical protein